MAGYDTDFLPGVSLPLPEFSPAIDGEVLDNIPTLQQGFVADYIHYSLVMNQHIHKRSPLFVALNINQNLHKSTHRSNRWRLDSRIDFEDQLDNDYYRNNPWDRGHMARRTTAAWGQSSREAQTASDETFYYTNSCLQHANLNQDEWLALEDWVYGLNLSKDGLISSFSGPFYGDQDRSLQPEGRTLARIPAGFFKVVCFVNPDNALDVRAFMIHQDEEALRDKKGRTRYNNQVYQVTITEIEERTGLRFDDAVYHANPLLFSIDDPVNNNPMGVTETPEAFEIGRPNEIIHSQTHRPTIHDDIVDIFVAAAMVDPGGPDQGNEWISLINLGSIDIDLTGWQLEDNSGAILDLNMRLSEAERVIRPGESRVIRDVRPLLLSNRKDIIRLFNDQGARIDWVNYELKMVKTGTPVLFLDPRDTLKPDIP